ncbi:hypothetical protein AO260_27015 [Pseudomonas sp. ABAC21]|nr:hypothetical protein AO260_27015 [Pseudomonas sp. ABAC21]
MVFGHVASDVGPDNPALTGLDQCGQVMLQKLTLIPVGVHHVRAQHILVDRQVHRQRAIELCQKRAHQLIGIAKGAIAAATANPVHPARVDVDVPVGQLALEQRRPVIFPGVAPADVLRADTQHMHMLDLRQTAGPVHP